jgi:hypothetical protein
VFCGDNLEQLAKLPAACVDLIYIDPAFNSNRNYEVFWGETKEKRAFADRHSSTQAYFTRALFLELACVLTPCLGVIAFRREQSNSEDGTLTYGVPKLTKQLIAPGLEQKEGLTVVASLERYSKDPLVRAIPPSAKEAGIQLSEATEVGEQPGQALRGTISQHQLLVTTRNKLIAEKVDSSDPLSLVPDGLECVVVIDQHYAAALRFRDATRAESSSFVKHLSPKHHFERVMLVSGDRDSAVHALAEQVGINEIQAE